MITHPLRFCPPTSDFGNPHLLCTEPQRQVGPFSAFPVLRLRLCHCLVGGSRYTECTSIRICLVYFFLTKLYAFSHPFLLLSWSVSLSNPSIASKPSCENTETKRTPNFCDTGTEFLRKFIFWQNSKTSRILWNIVFIKTEVKYESLIVVLKPSGIILVDKKEHFTSPWILVENYSALIQIPNKYSQPCL